MARTFLILYGLMIAATVVLQLAFGPTLLSLVEQPGLWTAGGFEADIGLGVALGLATVLLSRWLSAQFAWSRRIDAEFRVMLAPIEPSDTFGLAAMSALAEELFFRGFLQPIFGLTVTALAFGLVHFPHRRDQIPWPIAAAVMGFAFGGLTLLRGSIIAAIVAHFTINFFNLHHIIRPLNPEET
jgi:hypothetical protein